MSRVKRSPETTMEAPAKTATSILVGKPNGKNSRVNTVLDVESTIRVRAYELYEKRGRQDGLALHDWFQAEAEVRSHGSRTA